MLGGGKTFGVYFESLVVVFKTKGIPLRYVKKARKSWASRWSSGRWWSNQWEHSGWHRSDAPFRHRSTAHDGARE